MAAIYSTLLGRISQAAPAITTVFTAAAAGTTIIRDIQVRNGSGVPMTWYLLINGVGYGPSGSAMPVSTSFSEECRIVLEPGDVVAFWTSLGFGACMISGYVLV